MHRCSLKSVCTGRPGERITHRHDGNSPVRHAALGVVLKSLPKLFLRRVEPEGMEQGHGPIEILLRICATRHGKVDNLPELFECDVSQRALFAVLGPCLGSSKTQHQH